MRDFAEWTWSAYNYWSNEVYDVNTDKVTQWTDPTKQYRSNLFFENLLQLELNPDKPLIPLEPRSEGKIKPFKRSKRKFIHFLLFSFLIYLFLKQLYMRMSAKQLVYLYFLILFV